MVLKIFFHGLIATVLLINNSCSRETFPIEANDLTYKAKFVYNNQFKMNGVYSMSRVDEGGYAIRYFFQDGSYYAEGITNFDKHGVECYQIKEKVRVIPYAWGYFIIEGDTLKVQTFDPTSRERYNKFKVEERWAKVENDSTIRFFKKITPEKKIVFLNETFRFYPCANKPDSTNVLMDNI